MLELVFSFLFVNGFSVAAYSGIPHYSVKSNHLREATVQEFRRTSTWVLTETAASSSLIFVISASKSENEIRELLVLAISTPPPTLQILCAERGLG
jgi:hypothetical protein